MSKPKPFVAPEPEAFEMFTAYVNRLTLAFQQWANDEVVPYVEELAARKL